MIDVKKLRESAEKATPGKWRRSTWVDAGEGREVIADGVGHIRVACPMVISAERVRAVTATQRDADAAHVAAFNPTTVLALLDRLEAAERVCEAIGPCIITAPNHDLRTALAEWRRVRDWQGDR